MSNREPAHRPAGIVTRGIAAAIDLGVVLTVMGAIYLAVVLVRLLFSPQEFSFPDAHILLSVGVFVGVASLYLTVCWATTGRTVGAVVMGLRMVSRNGDLVGWVRAGLRAGLCVMFGFGLLWVAVDRRRRSLQDILLRTSVVYDWKPDLHLAEAER
ncbi:RDD family protein [Rhodococcus sp. 2H158]|nr:RDD domain-containing protein [Rhodococcus rhodochrous]